MLPSCRHGSNQGTRKCPLELDSEARMLFNDRCFDERRSKGDDCCSVKADLKVEKGFFSKTRVGDSYQEIEWNRSGNFRLSLQREKFCRRWLHREAFSGDPKVGSGAAWRR
ncbi:hypothetical protein COLO4_21813 [Corchorus olitorius]|uniref:Uncharacterized protein n=1 Tax=Corchorus olitorius TaxID=93759 RepID=A0A1R3IQM7_9ROSI|nr:hypothetical protein COLO4_21813 [Corchorus olitorius]